MTDADRERFEGYGLVILTTAVLAVIVSAPAGAICINSLGMILLPYDGDDPEVLAAIAKEKAEAEEAAGGGTEAEKEGVEMQAVEKEGAEQGEQAEAAKPSKVE